MSESVSRAPCSDEVPSKPEPAERSAVREPQARTGGSAADAAAALASGDDPQPGDYYALRLYGLRAVGQRLSLAADVAADVVDEAMAKFVSATQDRDLRADTALAYFRRIAQNEAIDRLRQHHEPPTNALTEASDGDDAIARFIDQSASAQMIEQLQASAAQRGDTTATRVLNAFMNLAEAQSRTPTTREVAGSSQVSHKTVQDVLRRVRAQLAPENFDL